MRVAVPDITTKQNDSAPFNSRNPRRRKKTWVNNNNKSLIQESKKKKENMGEQKQQIPHLGVREEERKHG